MRAVKVASSIRGRAPLWICSLTAPHALPPVPHHPVAPLREALSPHLPPSSFLPAGLSAGPAAGPAPVLVPTPAPAAPPHTTGGDPSPAHLTDAPPLGKYISHTHPPTHRPTHIFCLSLGCSPPMQFKQGLGLAGDLAYGCKTGLISRQSWCQTG